MIIINLEGERGKISIDSALKSYKAKHNKLKITRELNERKTFKKKSVARREEILKAKYIQKKRDDESN
jgi:small subunit ribosomal protein S21